MSIIPEKVTNTANIYIGGAKQSLGETLGNPDLAAAGASQKVYAETAQKVADAKTHAEGLSHSIQGNVQKTAGSLTGDNSLEATGEAKIARGAVERNV
ncbi:hypothetical protein BGZ98_010367 [Dissophora globulifera]|uniref:CsbD-like domain-containing protein n=1 Tax=Dissophora globulifera TaxID=979702 RepID=A0A9P6RRI4_9FUNG|nr:hypothetical protein BGZ98_010367 [Dissophora globulifera]KAG0326562.1 hypothetical protein BGZ99_009438 [Dissophora globulifera]